MAAANTMVPVNFSLTIDKCGDNEAVSHEMNGESVIDRVPIGDHLFLQASLETDTDTDVTLNSGISPLIDGKKVRILAYDGEIFMAYADYIFSDEILYPVTKGLTVPTNKLFTFVAYSYNNSKLPVHDPVSVSGIYPSDGLLWGSTTMPVTENNAVEINMSQLFSRITVRISSGDSTNTMSAKVDQHTLNYLKNMDVKTGKQATLDVFRGSVSIEADSTLSISFLMSLPADSILISNSPSMFVAVADTVKVEIDSISIGDVTYPGPYNCSFVRVLQPGKSYKIEINLSDL
ncbi:MAG: fimbrillin family protein [Tannerella sp.]|nr:fimbrillin family protein [Tannerella sp.]